MPESPISLKFPSTANTEQLVQAPVVSLSDPSMGQCVVVAQVHADT